MPTISASTAPPVKSWSAMARRLGRNRCQTLQRIADIPLPVHPEGFQLDPASSQVFVNLPKANAIAAADRRSGKLTASWPIAIAGDNFPMALRRDAGEILTVFRNPAQFAAFSIKDGALLPVRTSAAMPTTCSSTRNASASMSAAAKDSRLLDAKDSAYRTLHVLRRCPARGRPLCSGIGRLLLAVRAEPSARRASGYSARHSKICARCDTIELRSNLGHAEHG